MSILMSWLIRALAIILTSYLLPGLVHVQNFSSALVAALVLGIINTLIKPLLLILTLPINILSLGLFTFVINAVVILMVSNLVNGFTVNGFLAALVFSIILSLINSILTSLTS